MVENKFTFDHNLSNLKTPSLGSSAKKKPKGKTDSLTSEEQENEFIGKCIVTIRFQLLFQAQN